MRIGVEGSLRIRSRRRILPPKGGDIAGRQIIVERLEGSGFQYLKEALCRGDMLCPPQRGTAHAVARIAKGSAQQEKIMIHDPAGPCREGKINRIFKAAPLQALDRRLCLLPAAKAMAMVCVRQAELGGCRSNNERQANHARRMRFMFLGSSRFRARVLLGSGVSRVATGAYKNHETRPTREIYADDRP